jgi:hypothetical protein
MVQSETKVGIRNSISKQDVTKGEILPSGDYRLYEDLSRYFLLVISREKFAGRGSGPCEILFPNHSGDYGIPVDF